MTYFLFLLLGTTYGFLFGIIPVAGATTALITIFGFLDYFRADPYLLVVFTTAVVVASAIGDSFSSVVLNIPGASGSAATMVDGFPMSQRGEGARALGAAISTSVVNGLIWGMVVFLFLPYYGKAVLYFGIPEILAFLLLAFTTVSFISNQYWFRGVLALVLGIWLGLIGQHPLTGAERWTIGWEYLGGGIQLVSLMAGVMAFPELYEAYKNRKHVIVSNPTGQWTQIWQGFKDSWNYKWDGLRGGFIGAIIGIIPGIGGSVADWLAYGQTVALNKKEKIPFGEGNVKGVIGCEGANNAQKCTSYVPTVLFGIPGAPFEVIILSLFLLVGIELGTPELLANTKFFSTLSSSYFWSIIISFVISIFFIRYAIKITQLPFQYYFWPIILLLLWSSVQYTGYWEDYAIFAIFCLLGLILKKIKFGRASLLIGYVLADRFEGTLLQYLMLYDITDIFLRPISGIIMSICVIAIIYGVFFNKSRIKYI
jgi:TctA family transporter